MSKLNKKYRVGRIWGRWLSLCLCVMLLAGCAAPAGDDSSKPITQTGSGESGAGQSGDEQTEEDEGNDKSSALNKDVIYRETLLDLDLPMTREMEIVSGGGVVYLCGQNWDTDSALNTQIEYVIVSCDPTTGAVTKVYPSDGELVGSLEGGAGDSVVSLAATQEGDLVLLICRKVSWSEKHYQLVKVDSTGKLLWITDIGEVKKGSLVACSDRYVYTVGDENLLVYDLKTGKNEKQIDCSAVIGYGIWGIHPALDGQVYICCRVGESPYSWDLLPIEVESGEIGEAIDVPWKDHYLNFDSGMAVSSEFMMHDETILSVWNVGEENITEKINLLDSGIDGSVIQTIAAVEDGKFWAVVKTTVDGKYVEGVCELTKIPPEEIKEKTVITIGCDHTEAIRERILAFNRESAEYQVKVIDYSVYSYEDRVMRLNMDLISDNAPDVLLLDGFAGMVDDYIRQGFLEDLNTWIDSDPEIDRADYLNNIFEAYEVNGGLYELPTSFTVETLKADAKLVGDTPGLTMEELHQLEKLYPGYKLVYDSRSGFLKDMLRFGTMMDTVNGTCKFDSEEFIDLLEVAKQLPETTGEDKRSSLLDWAYIRNFEDFRRWEIQYNPNKVNYTYIGYPGVGGSGALIEDGRLSFAIISQSNHKEGAWQFIRYYLGDEYQTYVGLDSSVAQFPVKLSVLEAQVEAATKPISADGRDEDGTFMVAGLSEARAAELVAYLKSLSQTGRSDGEIYNIIVEEAGAFFADQKTAEEVAKIIQSRAWIYLAEKQ